jgi:two-component system CAI-1 autoinducer sensor kinase/phosphatase CqsS
MYSALPAIVSALFLGYGAYVVAVRGFNLVSTSFMLLCLTTFFWQAT